ncbi:unnamed protein product [Orchesella dallaii]|uniref:La protein n=1 Tax=Orchesella dallaii TaxID=48710 RepID=A0ABP1PQA3_9HEXA
MTQTEEKPVEVKQEASADTDEISARNEKLMTQVEYYFGDVNLPRDRFIKEECSKNDGWFPVANLLKFNRVANILKGIPNDDRVKTICEALKPSELIDVNDEQLKIRRSPDCPLSEKDTEERTVYLKGFNKTETVLDDLLEFFKKYEGVESVIMRYYKEKTIKTEAEIKKEREEKQGEADNVKQENEGETTAKNGAPDATAEKSEPQLVWIRKFKGSILVVFKTVEQAKKVLDDTDIVFRNTPITIKMWQAEYKALKTKEYEEKVANRKRKGDHRVKAEDDKEETKEEIIRGVLVKVLDVPEGFTREIIKERWYDVLDKEKFLIAFIDFNIGDKNAVLRLEREGAATEALEKLADKKLKMKADEDVFSPLEGFGEEEEVKYSEEIRRQRENMKHRKQGGRGGGFRGGRGGKRRRRF